MQESMSKHLHLLQGVEESGMKKFQYSVAYLWWSWELMEVLKMAVQLLGINFPVKPHYFSESTIYVGRPKAGRGS